MCPEVSWENGSLRLRICCAFIVLNQCTLLHLSSVPVWPLGYFPVHLTLIQGDQESQFRVQLSLHIGGWCLCHSWNDWKNIGSSIISIAWIGTPTRRITTLCGQFLVTVKLEHDSLDKIQHSNYVLVAINGLIVALPPPHWRGEYLCIVRVGWWMPSLCSLLEFLFCWHISLFYNPGLPYGPQFAQVYLPLLLAILAQTVLVSTGSWCRIAHHCCS